MFLEPCADSIKGDTYYTTVQQQIICSVVLIVATTGWNRCWDRKKWWSFGALSEYNVHMHRFLHVGMQNIVQYMLHIAFIFTCQYVLICPSIYIYIYRYIYIYYLVVYLPL